MPKVEVPFTGTEVSTNDPSGSVKSIVYGVVGISLALAMFAWGQALYNRVAEGTPSTQPVEVL